MDNDKLIISKEQNQQKALKKNPVLLACQKYCELKTDVEKKADTWFNYVNKSLLRQGQVFSLYNFENQ